MAWSVDYAKLDTEQREFVDNKDIDAKNIWIRGFPGSGKSVLLTHTLRRILRNDPEARVVIVVFTRALISMFKAALKEMNLTGVEIVTFYNFMHYTGEPYDYILCDEVQDLPEVVVEDLAIRAKHVIVAGDENQSIYDDRVDTSKITELINGESYVLHMIHRLSQDIIGIVQKLLPGLSIMNTKKDLTKESVQVILGEAEDKVEEARYVFDQAQKAVRINETAAILLPHHDMIVDFVNAILRYKGVDSWEKKMDNYDRPDYGIMNRYLDRNHIPLQYVGSGYGSFTEDAKLITIMTYHSAKGLDFDHVFLPGLTNQLTISPDDSKSKTLLMVAMTRSRKNLYITYAGERNKYIDNFAEDCHQINIGEVLAGKSAISSTNNIFGV